MANIKIGAPYCFVPSAFKGEHAGALPGGKEFLRRVNGRICYINRAHRYFRVAYALHGYKLSECFKF